MAVSSDTRDYRVEVKPADAKHVQELFSVWSQDHSTLSHSRSPHVLCSQYDNYSLWLWTLQDGQGKLVGYFPFEKTKKFGITVIHPAFHALTLDFIDISSLDGYEEVTSLAFYEWLHDQSTTVFDCFMLDESSRLAQGVSNFKDVDVHDRDAYHYVELPDHFEQYIAELGRSSRQRARKCLKQYSDAYTFEVVDTSSSQESQEEAITDLLRLHQHVFAENSMMVPQWEFLKQYIRRSLEEGTSLFFRAREIETGDIVGTEFYVQSHEHIGLYQRGRRVEEKYANIGTWLLVKIIEYSISVGKTRCEFLLGDQEWKRRYSNRTRRAVSVTYFSSQKVRYVYRILQRLGR